MAGGDSPDEGTYWQRDQQGDPDAAYELGNLLAGREDLAGAEAAWRRADERGHPTAAAQLGLLLQTRGDFDGALAAYQRSDERGDGLGALRLGLLLADQHGWDEARAAFARADQRGHAQDEFDLASVLGRGTAPEAVGTPGRHPFANPVLIGALTVLVALIAVFLAWIANKGLPFVPTRELKIVFANGANLVPGDDVLEGGRRIGFLSSLKPVRLGAGNVAAQLTVKLSVSQGKIPVDSRVSMRLRTVLGAKYLDLQKGSSSHVFPDGGTLPMSQTTVPVQLDEVLGTFNAPTRRAVQQDLQGFGDALTARGNDLNLTIQSLPALLQHLEPVAKSLAAPSTELTRFLNSLDALTGSLAPVSNQTAGLLRDAGITFQAITQSPPDYEATISRSPSTLTVSTTSLRAQQPLLADLTTLGRYLSPATAQLKAALPTLNPALEAGTTTLRRTPALNSRLQQVMSALRLLAEDPMTNVALNGLVSTIGTLNPMVRYLGPYETVCDYPTHFFTYLQDNVSEQSAYGTGQRILVKSANPLQPNTFQSPGATVPSNGGAPGGDNAILGGNAYYHNQILTAAIDNQGKADCEKGQQGYPLRLNYFDPLHRNFAIDPHTPGDQGPTFHGRAKVPAGETFSRNPQTGPQLPYNPSNP